MIDQQQITSLTLYEQEQMSRWINRKLAQVKGRMPLEQHEIIEQEKEYENKSNQYVR